MIVHGYKMNYEGKKNNNLIEYFGLINLDQS